MKPGVAAMRPRSIDSQNDPAKEAEHFENIVAAGYAAILFNPTDAKGSVANAMRARARQIPVFTMDRELDSQDATVSQVLSDNYSGAVAHRPVLRGRSRADRQLRRAARPGER